MVQIGYLKLKVHINKTSLFGISCIAYLNMYLCESVCIDSSVSCSSITILNSLSRSCYLGPISCCISNPYRSICSPILWNTSYNPISHIKWSKVKFLPLGWLYLTIGSYPKAYHISRSAYINFIYQYVSSDGILSIYILPRG